MYYFNRYVLMTAFFTLILAINAPAQSSRTKQWVSGIPDAAQRCDESISVIVRGTTMSQDEQYREKAWIKSARLKNCSTKNVTAIKLRWFSTTVEDPKREKILDKGEMEIVSVEILGMKTQEIKLPLPKLDEKLKRWMEENPSNKGFMIIISVSEVFFEDGTSWRAEEIR